MQAEALFSRSLESERRVLGPEHPDSLGTISAIVSMYQHQGKYALAESYAAQALAGRRHALGSEHPDTMASAADLALAYQSQGKFAEAEPLAREALEFDKKKQPDDWQRFRAEPAGRQLSWTEEICRSGIATARRLSRHGDAERPDRSLGLVSSGPRP